MFSDQSVAHKWTGRTQALRARQYAQQVRDSQIRRHGRCDVVLTVQSYAGRWVPDIVDVENYLNGC